MHVDSACSRAANALNALAADHQPPRPMAASVAEQHTGAGGNDTSVIDTNMDLSVAPGAVFTLTKDLAVQAMSRLGHPHAFVSPGLAFDYFQRVSLDMAFGVRRDSGGGSVAEQVTKLDTDNIISTSFPDCIDGPCGNNVRCLTIFCKQCKDVGGLRGSAKDYKGYKIQLAYSAGGIMTYYKQKLLVDSGRDNAATLPALHPCRVTQVQLQHLNHEFKYDDQVYTSQLSVSNQWPACVCSACFCCATGACCFELSVVVRSAALRVHHAKRAALHVRRVGLCACASRCVLCMSERHAVCVACRERRVVCRERRRRTQ